MRAVWSDITWAVGCYTHIDSSVWCKVPAEAPFSAIYYPVSKPLSPTTRRLWRHKTLFPGHFSTCPEMRWWSDVGPLAVSASLVAHERCAVTTIYWYLHCKSLQCTGTIGCYRIFCYKDNWHTVSAEDQLPYCQCQVTICVNVCQFHRLSMYLTDSKVSFTR